MDAIDKIQLMSDLHNEFCDLNHGPGISKEKFPVDDYIVMPFGYPENKLTDVTVREIIIPVCRECIKALSGDDWTLLYCFECGRSQWISRELAKNSYRNHILWLRGCPHCTGVFGGLYFTDGQEMMGGRIVFLRDQPDRIAA